MLVALSLLLLVGLVVVAFQIRRLQSSVVRLRAAGEGLEAVGSVERTAAAPDDVAELIASFDPQVTPTPRHPK